jgi:hypothetical protein
MLTHFNVFHAKWNAKAVVTALRVRLAIQTLHSIALNLVFVNRI